MNENKIEFENFFSVNLIESQNSIAMLALLDSVLKMTSHRLN